MKYCVKLIIPLILLFIFSSCNPANESDERFELTRGTIDKGNTCALNEISELYQHDELSFNGKIVNCIYPRNSILEKDTLYKEKLILYFSSDSLFGKLNNFNSINKFYDFYSIKICFYSKKYTKRGIDKELSFSKHHDPAHKESIYKFTKEDNLEGYEFITSNNSLNFRGEINKLNLYVDIFSLNKEIATELYNLVICGLMNS